MSRLLPRVGTLLVALALPALSLAAPAQAAPVDIDLLTANDFHGRLETAGTVGGAAVLAGAANEFRASNPNTLFVGAGDFIGASTFTSFIQDDNPTIDAMNASGLNVSSVGNHEYDQGWPDLRDDVIGGADGHPAEWPYLASNVTLKATGEPAPETPPYEVIETGGVRIGFIGAVTEDLPSLVSPDGIADLDVLPIVETVNGYADQLSDGDEGNGEADVVILLVHEDAQGALEEGANDNIDVIVAGHTHETYAYTQPSGRPVIQTGQYATNIGHINMTVDPDSGDITFNAVENLPLMACDAGGVCTPNFEPDPEVEQIVADAVEVAEELGSQPLGNITENITRAFDVVDGEEGPALAEDRGEESTLGNLVADAQRAATDDLPTGPAQIAFMNPGGLRADLCYAEAEYEAGLNVCVGVPDDGGVITYKDAATVQPFANTLVRMSLTGHQIMEVLEQQLQPEGSSRPFLHLGVSDGFEYTYDIVRDETGAPTAFTVDSMMLNGVEIDHEASYEVVVNSFLAAGGDNFATFAEGANPQDTGQIDLETFVDYMGEFSPVSPDPQERAVDNSLLGSATITWPSGLGDPPHIEAGTSEKFSLDTSLPIALPEDFDFTVEAPDGVTIEYGTRSSGKSFPVTIPGLPAGESSLPITVSVDANATPGDYELVFTLDRAGAYSVFDGNPLPTPASITVPLTINPVGLPPTGASSTSIFAAGLGAVLAGGVLLALAARRRRQYA
jgi:5'-nucleotidase